MKILIVEDEIKLANALKRALELQNYTVDVAFDGEKGMDLAIAEAYDLVILDIMLPRIDGTSICVKMRKQGIATPVIMLTARGQINDKITGLDSGADDYIVKPFSMEELFARVRALVRRVSKQTDNILRVGDLTLDSRSYVVKRGERTIRLSRKEFSILQYLMRHKNTILTREQIVSHIWNYDDDVLPSTIEVHIKHLRDKIDQDTHKLIYTVRGFGYKIGN